MLPLLDFSFFFLWEKWKKGFSGFDAPPARAGVELR